MGADLRDGKTRVVGQANPERNLVSLSGQQRRHQGRLDVFPVAFDRKIIIYGKHFAAGITLTAVRGLGASQVCGDRSQVARTGAAIEIIRSSERGSEPGSGVLRL